MKEIGFISFGEFIIDKFYSENLNLLKSDIGGTVWNILLDLALLKDTEKLFAFGVCGNDLNSQFIKEKLVKHDIDITNIQELNKLTNIVNIIVPDEIEGDNSILYSCKSPIDKKETFELSIIDIQNIKIDLNNIFPIIILENFMPFNIDFINKFKEKKIVIDIGRVKIIENIDKNYIIELLINSDLIQINSKVLEKLYEKLDIKSLEELYSIASPELMISTNGSNAVTFIFKENDKIKKIMKSPKITRNIKDTTGAGDAFLSSIIYEYGKYIKRNKKIDSYFIEKVFPLANQISSKVIGQIGANLFD